MSTPTTQTRTEKNELDWILWNMDAQLNWTLQTERILPHYNNNYRTIYRRIAHKIRIIYGILGEPIGAICTATYHNNTADGLIYYMEHYVGPTDAKQPYFVVKDRCYQVHKCNSNREPLLIVHGALSSDY